MDNEEIWSQPKPLFITVSHEINYNTNLSELIISIRNLYVFGHSFRGCFDRERSQNLESAFKFVARSNRLASRIPELNCANRAGGSRALCAPVVEILILASAFFLSFCEGVASTGCVHVDLSSQASTINHCARAPKCER